MKKKLKGFTLLELIIVLAIFSIIMVGALSLVDPVSKINSRAKNNENSYAYVDNIQNYLQDSLEFADHLWIYQGVDADYTDDKLAEEAKAFKNAYYKDIIATKDGADHVGFADCTIRVMTILNKDTTVKGTTYPKGQILMRSVKYQSDANTLIELSDPVPMLNDEYFNDKYMYDYVIGAGNFEPEISGGSSTGYYVLDTLADNGADVCAKLSPSNFALTIVAYQTKADRNGRVSSLVNDYSRRYPAATHYSVANLPLFNIIERSNTPNKKYWVDKAAPKNINPAEAVAFEHPHDPANNTISMKQEDNIHIVFAMADEIGVPK